METTRKAVLQEILSRENGSCSLADAAALDGARPVEILACFSFAEFYRLIARLRAQSAPVDHRTQEVP